MVSGYHAWRAEALEEDLEATIEQQVNNGTIGTYVRTFDAALVLIANQSTPAEVRDKLHRPPPAFDARMTRLQREEHGVESGLAKVRLNAIEDAIAGREPSHRLRSRPR